MRAVQRFASETTYASWCRCPWPRVLGSGVLFLPCIARGLTDVWRWLDGSRGATRLQFRDPTSRRTLAALRSSLMRLERRTGGGLINFPSLTSWPLRNCSSMFSPVDEQRLCITETQGLPHLFSLRVRYFLGRCESSR